MPLPRSRLTRLPRLDWLARLARARPEAREPMVPTRLLSAGGIWAPLIVGLLLRCTSQPELCHVGSDAPDRA